MVLDILLPGRSGLDALRDLRAAGNPVPVLMLTAKADVVDRVVGLELGADDYLPKPFAVRELLARVRALRRRAASRPPTDPELTVRGVRFEGDAIDVDFKGLGLPEAFRRLAQRGGREVSVDPTVAGRVTLVLKAVPWDQALDLIARLNGLAWKQDGTSIRVGRAEDLR